MENVEKNEIDLKNFQLEIEDTNGKVKSFKVNFRRTTCVVKDELAKLKIRQIEENKIILSPYTEANKKNEDYIKSANGNIDLYNMFLASDSDLMKALVTQQNEIEKSNDNFIIERFKAIIHPTKGLQGEEKELIAQDVINTFWQEQDIKKLRLAVDFFISSF